MPGTGKTEKFKLLKKFIVVPTFPFEFPENLNGKVGTYNCIIYSLYLHIFRLFILLHSRENSDKFAGILKKQNDVCSRTYKLNGKSLLQIKMKLENVISTQLRMKGTTRSLI